MKKMLLCVLILLSFYNTKAVCNDKSINDWAEKVNIKMDIIKDDYVYGNLTSKDIPFSYILMLNNPRTDIVVKAKDSLGDNYYNVEFDNDFKNYVVGSLIHFEDKKYTFDIYMSDSSEICAGEKVKTIEYTVSKYNTNYNDTVYCEDNPDSELCGEYTNTDKTRENDKLVNDYNTEKLNKEEYKLLPWYEKVFNIVKAYALYVVVPLLIITVVYTFIIKKQKKRSDRR